MFGIFKKATQKELRTDIFKSAEATANKASVAISKLYELIGEQRDRYAETVELLKAQDKLINETALEIASMEHIYEAAVSMTIPGVIPTLKEGE